jgi:hypothetical protein
LSATFILDAAPAMEIANELIALADVVTVNSEEAQVLSQIDIDDQASALAAAHAIRRRGARAVTIGLAEGGAVVSDAGDEWLPSLPVHVIDTTGAGDACAAAIAVALAEARSFTEACVFGHAAAALATTALAHLPRCRRAQPWTLCFIVTGMRGRDTHEIAVKLNTIEERSCPGVARVARSSLRRLCAEPVRWQAVRRTARP